MSAETPPLESLPARVPPRRSRRWGFSLVELVVGAMVVGTVMVSTISALQGGFTMLDQARMESLAGQFLQSEMENLRLMGWSEIGDNTTADGTPARNTALASMTQPINRIARLPALADADAPAIARFTEFSLTIADSTDPQTGAARPLVKRLTLTARWTDMRGGVRTRTYEGFYAKDGLNDYLYTVLRP